MPLVNIDSVGEQGVVKDRAAHTLDPVAWTELLNARCLEGSVHSMPKCLPIFGTLPDTPAFLLPVVTNTETFWLWMSLTAGWVYDGANHTEITRASGPYTASFPHEWNGVNFAGIPIVNNGIDVPQFWSPISTGQVLQDLTNWPATLRAKVIRALGPHLIAFNVTDTGNSFPHMVQWSHPADPGALPSSWAIDDPTKDSGRSELPDVNSGVIKDALPLRGQMIIYKERATWRMRFIGGRSIFAFDSLFDTSGIMGAGCATLVGDGMRHFVATKDDVVQHDGQSMQSVVDRRMRRTIFSNIDVNNPDVCFAFTDRVFKECWFCYPEAGSSQATRALIWNYGNNTLYEAEVDFITAVDGPNTIGDNNRIWDDVNTDWNVDPHIWDFAPTTIVVTIKLDGSFCALNLGAAQRTVVQRTGLALVGRKRDGSAIVDFNSRKMVTRVWPRVQGVGPIRVRLGSHQLIDGGVQWTAAQVFDPASMEYLDFIVEGRAIAIELSNPDGSGNWITEGYKLEMEVIAEF